MPYRILKRFLARKRQIVARAEMINYKKNNKDRKIMLTLTKESENGSLRKRTITKSLSEARDGIRNNNNIPIKRKQRVE